MLIFLGTVSYYKIIGGIKYQSNQIFVLVIIRSTVKQ